MKTFKELRNEYSIAKLIKKFDDCYGFQRLVSCFTGHWFNPFATLYVNLFSFPFRQAIKLPIFVYGSPGIYYVVGKMRIDGKVKTGMIDFNKTKRLNLPHQLSDSELSNLDAIIFHGKASIGCASKILVQKNALLEVGDNVLIGDEVNFCCHQHVILGDYVHKSSMSNTRVESSFFIESFDPYRFSLYPPDYHWAWLLDL